MATIDEVLAMVQQMLGKMSTRPDGGDWGVPADYSVIVRQDQPPDTGSSQYKTEDAPMAADTVLLRESAADIAGKKISTLGAIATPGAGDVVLAESSGGLLKKIDSGGFPWLNGRSGGQTLIGGTASGNDLTLQSTSHATKGQVIIGETGDVVMGSSGTSTTWYPDGNGEVDLGKPTKKIGKVVTLNGIVTKVATDNIAGSTPTDAELDSAFGAPATVGAGFTAVLDDNGAGTAVFLCVSDGANWWYQAMTKAI